MGDLNLLPGVSADDVRERLARAGGKDIASGRFARPESPAALAANIFGWFAARPNALPPFPGLEIVGTPTQVEIGYCARFAWSGGRHPWLDAAVVTPTYLVGIESRRFEPWRDRTSASLAKACDRPVRGHGMRPFERLRDALRERPEQFHFRDAAQLIKHAFGLVTEAGRRRLAPVLVCLHAEPAMRDGRPMDAARFARHRAEIARFATAVPGAEVVFAAVSDREWLSSWPTEGDVADHGRNLREAFAP